MELCSTESSQLSRCSFALKGAGIGGLGISSGCILGTFHSKSSRYVKIVDDKGRPRTCLRDYISNQALDSPRRC